MDQQSVPKELVVDMIENSQLTEMLESQRICISSPITPPLTIAEESRVEMEENKVDEKKETAKPADPRWLSLFKSFAIQTKQQKRAFLGGSKHAFLRGLVKFLERLVSNQVRLDLDNALIRRHRTKLTILFGLKSQRGNLKAYLDEHLELLNFTAEILKTALLDGKKDELMQLLPVVFSIKKPRQKKTVKKDSCKEGP